MSHKRDVVQLLVKFDVCILGVGQVLVPHNN